MKISDRIHAISFGKFYLKIFNEKIEPQEIKEIFRDWNISNRSSFIDQNAEDYDPKFLEQIIKMVDKIKGTK